MNRGAALVTLHASVALFAFAALFGKWIDLPATAIVLGRTMIAAATLALVIAGRRTPVGGPDPSAALNGAILAVHWVSFFAAVQVATVAVGLLGYASFPLFVLVLERRLSTHGTRIGEWATAGLAALGLLAVVPEFDWSNATLRGLLLGTLSGFTFALLAVRNRRLVARLTPVRIAFWQNAFAALCLLPVVVIADGEAAFPHGADIALLVVLGVVCTGVAHTLFIGSLQRVSAHTASVIAALEPVYGIVLAAGLLHEIPNLRTSIGAVLLVGAALIASRRV